MKGGAHWKGGPVPLIAPEILGDIISMAADLSLVVSQEGRIISVLRNPTSRGLEAADGWEGRDIRDCLIPDSMPKVERRLAELAQGEEVAGATELNHIGGTGHGIAMRYSFHRLGPDGTVLMLGRDLRPVAEMQEQLVKAQLALERDYEMQRDYDTRYRVLMETAREPILFVAIGSGRVTDANPAAAALFETTREDLTGSVFATAFEGRRRGEFVESLIAAALGTDENGVSARIARSGEELRLVPRAFRAAGERLLLIRVERDKIPAAEEGSALNEDLSALFQECVDAIVFTDDEGVIRTANESFLNLTDSVHASAVKGHSLGQFLSRGAVDLKVLLDNVRRAGQMRLYSTRLSGQFGNQTPVEISATWLADRSHPAVVFVIRDSSRAEALRKPGIGVSDDALRGIMEQVGSATLKDIVAETTDVVEKMCIETAVELTRNNRVAAAEMLGLSRQSLYVKLRKYGLLSRDAD